MILPSCRKLLEEESEPSPLRLPSFSASWREAFARGVDADDVLGGGAEAAAAGLLEPSVLPFQRCVCTVAPFVLQAVLGWAVSLGTGGARQGAKRSLAGSVQ
jgi:hypothetical protein